ncbi:cobalt ECF transporter T component CbiQ [bacterium]|jgi:cobalt/nickel transport system permease protein|nr:cobalt ECF transporter T component CbiQ [bacterium]
MQTSRPRSRVIEHTLHGIAETVERSLFAEEISTRPGLLQSLDPRVKLIATLALILSVGLSRNLLVLVGLYFLALLLAWRSAIPADFFIKRVWLLLPFFTGFIVLPALFITPGPPLVQLPLGLVITVTGAQTVLFLLLRVSSSVSYSLLLILTTPWNTVLSALSVLRLPDEIVLVLGMTYRYIFLLLRSANDMFLSRQSRVVGRLSSAEERKMIAASIGTLLNRSLNLSSEVYLAMVSRGFRGKIRTLKPFKMQPRDWAWGAGLLAISILAVILGR